MWSLILFLLDLIWINRFFKEKCVFSFIRQFDVSRRDRYTTYRFQKVESLGKNNFVYKFFKWND